MPLPTTDQAWPPKELATITPTLEVWSAWYEGTPEALRTAYAGGRTTPQARRQGGVRGLVQRFWWGREIDTQAERPDQLHIPAAADLARISADLLYAQPPTLTVDDTTTQARLDEYIEAGLPDVLAAGAEVGAVLGGRYQRVTWDPAVADAPFLTTVDADAAIPEFRWGRLVAVTFWHAVVTDGQRVLRHLERHELDATGVGLVFHGLYEGTGSQLGRTVPLTEHPATAALAPLVGPDGALIAGRTPGLAVEYIPNQLPQRRWRKDPVGRNFGRSDLDGVEPLMDGLDETYSSLMRDIRLGKGRIIVPAYMLDTRGPGQGAEFNFDRAVYEALNQPAPEDGRSEITPQQFAIRVDEHLRVCDDLTHRIISAAGYSEQTLSDGVDTGPMTATEIHARERRSYRTRDRKIRSERPALARLAAKMLTVDAAVFRTQGLKTGPVTVTFGPGVQDSPLALAQTVQALDVARAVSTLTKVRMLNPEWTDIEVLDEVDRVAREQGLDPVADPDAVLPGGALPASTAEDPETQGIRIDNLGKLIRSGATPESSAEVVGGGLEDVEFTGAVPVTLRQPETEAAKLEQV